MLENEVAIDTCVEIANALEELQINIISCWENFVNDPVNAHNANDALMRVIDRFQHEIHSNEDDDALISQNGAFSAADDQPEFNIIYRNVTNIIDDDSEIVQWDTEYDFNINQQQYIICGGS